MTSYRTLPRLSGIYVPIFDPVARRALVNMAEREGRPPKEQAAWLILDGLRAAGALPIEVTDYRDVTDAVDDPPATREPTSDPEPSSVS